MRNLDKLSILTPDRGYGWEFLRHKFHFEVVKPMMENYTIGCHGLANNVFLDDTTPHQGSSIESTFFALRRKYGENVRARTCFGQVCELVLSTLSETSNSRLALQTHDFGRLNNPKIV